MINEDGDPWKSIGFNGNILKINFNKQFYFVSMCELTRFIQLRRKKAKIDVASLSRTFRWHGAGFSQSCPI
jgi:hypothetical protein